MAWYFFSVQISDAVNSTGSILNYVFLSSKPMSNTEKLQSKQIEEIDHDCNEKASSPRSPRSFWSESSSTRTSFNDSETDSSSVSNQKSDSTDESVSQIEPAPAAEADQDAAAVPDMAEIRVVFDRFDENSDGLICALDLVQFAERLGFKMSLQEAKVLVESSDRNNDGKLDFEEFYSLYKSLGGWCPEVKRLTEQAGRAEAEEDENALREAFGVYDSDRNGYICAKELQAVLRNMGLPEGRSLRGCERVIRRVASKPENGITLGEFKSMMCGKSSPACSLKSSKSFP